MKMSGYRCVNYFELCRLCTASHGQKTHIFSDEGRRKDLIGKIAVCLPVVIDENDKLPKILCSQCLNQIESIAKFRETCINAQTMLESCLNSSKLRNGGKVYIKDVVTKKGVNSTALTTTNAPAPALTSIAKTSQQTTTQNIVAMSTAPPLVKTTYQPKLVATNTAAATTTVTPPSDFLSSIIKAVGIQNMDDTPEIIPQPATLTPMSAGTTTTTTAIPQYTITLDSKTIKSNQIHYKIEPAKPIQQEQPVAVTTSYQNSVEEFLKLKSNPQISATIVKREAAAIKVETSPQPAKKQKINFLITSAPSNNTQQQQQQHQQIKQQVAIKQNSTATPTQTTTTAVVQKQVSLQDLKLLSPNKCYLPITLKDGGGIDQQIVAQIDTKNLVLPTAYLQMKLRPQITSIDSSQHVVHLTNMPASLALTTSTPTQIRQQQATTTQYLSPITLPTSSGETKTILTSSNDQNVTITHQPIVHSISTTQSIPQSPSAATLTALSSLQSLATSSPPQLTAVSTPHTSTIDTPAGKVQLTMLQNVPTSTITHALPQKSGITIQRIKPSESTQKTNQYKGFTMATTTAQAATIASSMANTQTATIVLAAPTPTTAATVGSTYTVVPSSAVTSKVTNAKALKAAGQSNNVKKIETRTVTASTGGTTTATAATATTSANQKSPENATSNGQTMKNEVPTCDVCDKVFKRKEHLAQHAKLHLGLRPFKCEEPNCNKAFSRKEHLMRHVVSHSGKKMFSCEFCQKLFSRKDNLNKHRRSHDGTTIVQFTCKICLKTFNGKALFEQHNAQHADQLTQIKIEEIENTDCGVVVKQERNNTKNNMQSTSCIVQNQQWQNVPVVIMER